MPAITWVALTLSVAVITGWGVWRWAKAHSQPQGAAPVRVLSAYSPVLTWLRDRQRLRLEARSLDLVRLRAGLALYLELALVGLLAVYFGRGFLDLSPTVWPDGGEFAMGIQTHYVWTLLRECGACIAWNGFTAGGVPTFVDVHGAPLHPLVVATTLVWGVVNGAKITVVVCLALAGWAQWWLARSMGLGRVARLWASALAVVAGHVAGRLQIGLVPLALSMAMSALLIAAVVDLALKRTRGAALRLGLILALTLLSGQGYLQIGLGLSVLPALALLLVSRTGRLTEVWKEYARAGVLGVLLAGVLLVPLARFWPHIDKDRDPGFGAAQPAAYAPLNLVIADPDFLNSEALGKQAFPYLYANYIGWVPVLLALGALYLAPRNQRRLLLFFLVAIGLVYLASGATTLRWIERVAPNSMAAIRNPSLMAGLAVPLILALAAWSVDRLAKADWPRLKLALVSQSATGLTLSLSLAWLVLPLPLLWSAQSAYRVNRFWLNTFVVHEGIDLVTDKLVELVPAGQAQWVQTPWGEHYWLPAAMDRGLKVASYFRPWRWRDAEFPAAYVEATRDPAAVDSPNFQMTVDGLHLLVHPENQYAFVDTPSGPVPCQATARGGNVDVVCRTDEAGMLVVREHMLRGWTATRDGATAQLAAPDWLSVEAPAGEHTYRLRYRPWDVALGLLVTLFGIILLVRWWPRPAEPAALATEAPRAGPELSAAA